MTVPRDIKIIVILAATLTALVTTIAVYFEGHNEILSLETAYCITTAAGCDVDWFNIVFDLAWLAFFFFAVTTAIGLLFRFLRSAVCCWYLFDRSHPATPINPWLRNTIIAYLVIAFSAAGLLAGVWMLIELAMNHDGALCRIDAPPDTHNFYTSTMRCTLAWGDLLEFFVPVLFLLNLTAQAPAWLLWMLAFNWRQRKSNRPTIPPETAG
ncbi:MAG: hypothetical protein ACI9MJ_002143 [Alphaproteobacteria bacterium]|jgi:hypothetical protein